MKAAVLYELGRPLVVEDGIEVPSLERGQVLVRVFYSGVCHSQLMEARGKRGPDPHLPHLLGHEGSGVVEAIGEGVTKIKIGDRVILGWIKGTGLDASGTFYKRGTEIINAGSVTTFNEQAVVSENRCVKLPEGLPLDIAVLCGCAIPTGAGILTNTIEPAVGSTIAIFGLGGIGLSALMASQLYECTQVIAVDVEDAKLELAKELGATSIVNSGQVDPVAAIMNLTGGRGVDYSIEAAGRTDTIEQAFRAVRDQGGRCVFASHPEFGRKIRLDPFDLICGKRIEGNWGGSCYPDRDIPRFVELYKSRKLPLEKLVTRRYTLDQINEALEDLEYRRVGRPLIVIGETE